MKDFGCEPFRNEIRMFDVSRVIVRLFFSNWNAVPFLSQRLISFEQTEDNLKKELNIIK